VSERDTLRVAFGAWERGVSSRCLWGKCRRQIGSFTVDHFWLIFSSLAGKFEKISQK